MWHFTSFIFLSTLLLKPNLMKNLFLLPFLCVLLIACKNTPQEKPTTIVTENTQKDEQKTTLKKDSITQTIVNEALSALKKKDFQAFARLIHPKEGIRFSPYGYIDTLSDRKYSAENFLLLMSDAKKPALKWGRYDGTGETMKLTAAQYFSQFVYDADFFNAPSNTLNKQVSAGNSVNNIAEIYKNSQFSESHFAGIDKKMAGMDWRTLRLVFKQLDTKWYVVGVVHDQWTS